MATENISFGIATGGSVGLPAAVLGFPAHIMGSSEETGTHPLRQLSIGDFHLFDHTASASNGHALAMGIILVGTGIGAILHQRYGERASRPAIKVTAALAATVSSVAITANELLGRTDMMDAAFGTGQSVLTSGAFFLGAMYALRKQRTRQEITEA